MAHKIIFTSPAENDLVEIYNYIADQSNPLRAESYTERIKASCRSLSRFPARGVERDHARPGMRTIGFERRVTIVFHIKTKTVLIDRILYGGRSLEKAFADDE